MHYLGSTNKHITSTVDHFLILNYYKTSGIFSYLGFIELNKEFHMENTNNEDLLEEILYNCKMKIEQENERKA